MEQPIPLFTGVSAHFVLQALDLRREASRPGYEDQAKACLGYSAESFRSARKWHGRD